MPCSSGQRPAFCLSFIHCFGRLVCCHSLIQLGYFVVGLLILVACLNAYIWSRVPMPPIYYSLLFSLAGQPLITPLQLGTSITRNGHVSQGLLLYCSLSPLVQQFSSCHFVWLLKSSRSLTLLIFVTCLNAYYSATFSLPRLSTTPFVNVFCPSLIHVIYLRYSSLIFAEVS